MSKQMKSGRLEKTATGAGAWHGRQAYEVDNDRGSEMERCTRHRENLDYLRLCMAWKWHMRNGKVFCEDGI